MRNFEMISSAYVKLPEDLAGKSVKRLYKYVIGTPVNPLDPVGIFV